MASWSLCFNVMLANEGDAGLLVVFAHSDQVHCFHGPPTPFIRGRFLLLKGTPFIKGNSFWVQSS